MCVCGACRVVRGLEFLQPVVASNPKFVNFLQGFVPPLVLVVFFALVPTFMLLLARLEAHPAESDCQTAAISVRPPSISSP